MFEINMHASPLLKSSLYVINKKIGASQLFNFVFKFLSQLIIVHPFDE